MKTRVLFFCGTAALLASNMAIASDAVFLPYVLQQFEATGSLMSVDDAKAACASKDLPAVNTPITELNLSDEYNFGATVKLGNEDVLVMTDAKGHLLGHRAKGHLLKIISTAKLQYVASLMQSNQNGWVNQPSWVDGKLSANGKTMLWFDKSKTRVSAAGVMENQKTGATITGYLTTLENPASYHLSLNNAARLELVQTDANTLKQYFICEWSVNPKPASGK
jgi:hypothetical protein